MKRIEFIAPVEAMRGNLSGKQTLVYAENDNPAYDAPVGRQYARNYRPSFIGAKRASDGRKYFSVKTKSATLITAASKKRMAILGGAGAVYASILAHKSSATYIALVALFEKQNKDIREKGMRKFFCDWAFNALAVKAQYISIPDLSIPAGAPVEVKNPWYDGTQTTGVEISNAILNKFFAQLAPNAIKFGVSGVGVGHCYSEDTMGAIIAGNYNSLGLIKVTIDEVDYIAVGTAEHPMFLSDSEPDNPSYITTTYVVSSNQEFFVTEVAPQ